MSGQTESLSRQISSASDLRVVVRSMKAVAAASIGQYEKAVESLRAYTRAVELALSVALRQVSPVAESLKPRENTLALVVFGSDQGLVGSFNESIVDFAVNAVCALPITVRRAWAIGERARELLADSFPDKGVELLPVPGSIDALAPLVEQLLVAIEAAREKGDAAKVLIYYNAPRPGALYEPASRQLLPLDAEWHRRMTASAWPTAKLPEVVEGEVPALEAFVREYLFVLLFQACAASLASENASRLAAMQRAEKNIEGMLDDLNRTYHRLRQEAIDEELFDVVSGFHAQAKPKS